MFVLAEKIISQEKTAECGRTNAGVKADFRVQIIDCSASHFELLLHSAF
jgi:hypothetical protein